jgi:hypothetical protein
MERIPLNLHLAPRLSRSYFQDLSPHRLDEHKRREQPFARIREEYTGKTDVPLFLFMVLCDSGGQSYAGSSI